MRTGCPNACWCSMANANLAACLESLMEAIGPLRHRHRVNQSLVTFWWLRQKHFHEWSAGGHFIGLWHCFSCSSAAVLRTVSWYLLRVLVPCETINLFGFSMYGFVILELNSEHLMGAGYPLMLPAITWKQMISQKTSREGIVLWPPEKPFLNRCCLANGLTRHLLFCPIFTTAGEKKNPL